MKRQRQQRQQRERRPRKHQNHAATAIHTLKKTMKEVANPNISRFHQWDTDSLKNLLVENNVQIRGSANASHSTLVRICDDVFGPFDEYDNKDNENDEVVRGGFGGQNEYDFKSNDTSINVDNHNERSGRRRNENIDLLSSMSFTFDDLAKMNWAALKIQKVFIANRQRMYEKTFLQNQQQHQHQQQDENHYDGQYEGEGQYEDQNDVGDQYGEQYHDGEQNHQYDNEYEHEYEGDGADGEVQYQYGYEDDRPAPSAPMQEGNEDDIYYEHLPLHEEYTYDNQYQKEQGNNINEEGDLYIHDNAEESHEHSVQTSSNHDTDQSHIPISSGCTEQDQEEEYVDELDEELETEWRKPSWKFAKKFEAENRPHKSGKDMKKYTLKDTLGRHCTIGGCGEQLDLWDEGATSEFSQFGSGITNYFKFLKWCCWIMLILSIIHIPAIVINVLGSSSGDRYESTLAILTLGSLGNAKDADFVTIAGCENDAYQFDTCRIKKNHLALFYSFLDACGTLIIIIGWVWLRAFEKREVDHLNRSTVNASDYTIRVTGIPPKTKERELAVHFANITNEAVAEVNLAYKNNKAIQFYYARGKVMRDRIDCIQRIRYEKSINSNTNRSNRKINRRLRKLLDERRKLTGQIALRDLDRKEHVDSNPDAIQAFVTFETEEGFLKAISAYQVNWIRTLCYPRRLYFKGEKLKLSQAPEPTTIIWENLEFSPTSRFGRKCLTTFIASLAILMSIYFTFLSKDFREELTKGMSNVCPDYLTDLTRKELNQLADQNYSLRHCYCSTLEPQEQWEESKCVEYMKGAVKASVMNYGAGFMVCFMNMFFTVLMDKAGSFEKHESLDAMESSNMTRVFLLKLINTGCLVLLYNISLIQKIVGVRFEDPQNFNVGWFETGGVGMITVMCINVISPHIGSLIQYRKFRGRIKKLEKRGLTAEKETDDKFKIWYTQEELNSVYLGPPFRLNYRYTQLLVTFFICWMYAISMPILPLIGALSFYISFWVDKFLFCNFYRIPPKYSDDIGARSTSLIGYGILLHIFMSCWILGSNQVFTGRIAFGIQNNVIDTNNMSNNITRAMLKEHIIPLEVIAILFVVGLIMKRSLMTMFATSLKFLRCLICMSGSNIMKLKKTLNTVQVGYSAARARGVIKGLATYNILQNPKYQEAFAISSEFAMSHKRLKSIRGFNTKEGGLCISNSSSNESNNSSREP